MGLFRLVPRSGCNWVLTHWGVFPCTIHIDALVPRRSITAGVPGPRRNADDRDAGWFAPVATRRRPNFAAFRGGFAMPRCTCRVDNLPDLLRGPLWAVVNAGMRSWAAGWSGAGTRRILVPVYEVPGRSGSGPRSGSGAQVRQRELGGIVQEPRRTRPGRFGAIRFPADPARPDRRRLRVASAMAIAYSAL